MTARSAKKDKKEEKIKKPSKAPASEKKSAKGKAPSGAKGPNKVSGKEREAKAKKAKKRIISAQEDYEDFQKRSADLRKQIKRLQLQRDGEEIIDGEAIETPPPLSDDHLLEENNHGLVDVEIVEEDEASAAIRNDMMAVLRETGVYREHKAFVDRWEELAHRKAFSEAFSLGVRRRASSFDEERYIHLFFEELISRAENFEKKKELGRTLRELRADILAGDS